MYKIGVLGDKDSIFIFKLLGLDIFPCIDVEDAKQFFYKLTSENYAIIFITENIAQKIIDIIEKFQKRHFSSIVLIPSSKGSLGIGVQNISYNVEKAVGINIL